MNRSALFLMMAAIALPTTARAEMTAEQKQEVEALVKQYILDHGDVLIESVNKYQAKQEAETNKASEAKAKELLAKLKTDKSGALAGNPDGDVLLVEFFDYNCGYCKKAFDEIQSLLKDDKNVKVVFYDMPILSPDSIEAAKWGLASIKQGKYFEYHTALMTHQGAHDEDVLKKLAGDVGLDVDQLMKDKAAPEIEATIKSHIDLAKDLNIQGTPGFLINDKVFRGYIPYDVIKETIKSERAAAKK